MDIYGLPDLDVARVKKYCTGAIPAHLQHEIRIECDVAPNHLTIYECLPRWDDDDTTDEWTRFPIARLRFTRSTGMWTLYWRDHKLKFHRYTRANPSRHVQDLLEYLDTTKDPIFWG